MSWSYVLVAAVAMAGAVVGLATATVVVMKVPSVRKATIEAVRNAIRPNELVPLPNEIPKPVETAPVAEPFHVQGIQPDRSVRLGYFVIETDHAERTRLLVEMFLERETKRWRLDGSSGNGNGNGRGRKSPSGRAMLMYLVRFRKNTEPTTVLERLSAVGHPADFTVRLEADSDDAA